MAPSAIDPISTISSHNGTGKALEEMSDKIDAINVLKDELRKKSEFDADKVKAKFRQYDQADETVVGLYRTQHENQTVAYNLWARNDFKSKVRAKMSIWEAMERLNKFVDDSDPDTSLSQIQHLLQSAEAMRRDGKPRWMQVTGLIHDLGKLICAFRDSQAQWDVVGDTFPVGCAWSPGIIYSEKPYDTFEKNPDTKDPIYSTKYGIYSPGCGIDNIMLSWGHDEYLYHVVKDQSTLPAEALAMIRYHSFYPWHKEGAYKYFMTPHDEKMLEAVQAFNPYDLYSKDDGVPDVETLKPYYMELIDEFFPKKVLDW
ncbi:putative inositol oxygenase [Lachnellula hyalina]|uniref:Inositol oxygenase n=1 Tax=Lachnellula hyalina TaxID=1316788 RepID=A0A8H8U1D2_9HELO|nr:putative inositol oxygenase [Lachnellula hyalina]TVY28240.1 putative inositol oxygenase [Lachnellula hyalina]